MSKTFLSEFTDVSSSYVQGLATKAEEYKTLYEAGELSQPEYVELLKDIKSQQMISESAQELAEKELLNTAINGLIAVAGAV
jgi:phosphoribosylformylglycinamidine (FGAM) synthase PurS component